MKAKISFLALVCLTFVFLLALPGLAGTWRDDFEDGDFDGWEVVDAIPAEKWGVEDGECSGEFFGAPGGLISLLLLNEGHFPQANYAFDNSVLSLQLTQFIEDCGKHWVSELECSRNIQWHGQWVRVDEVARELREQHPESFRHKKVQCRNGETKDFGTFTKVVRLKRYGRKRLVIVYETEDLTDTPRFLLTDARHWESQKIIQTWSYRWAAEIFHGFDTQATQPDGVR